MILMYHSIDEYRDDPFLVTVTPSRFDKQLDWIVRRGLRGVSVGEYLRARRAGTAENLVALTFDDGFRDFVANAVPRLVRRGFTATVYPVAARLGGTNAWEDRGPVKPLLTADGVRTAADAGMEVGSHGLLHVRLTGLDDDDLSREIEGSREELAGIVGADVAGFCYPYGESDERVEKAVRAAGYEYACSIKPRQAGDHALPRVYIGDRDGRTRLAAKFLLAGRPGR
jgi:peptidoglycan/xylan/chitin deacetylase (PgdA/CDA1 family)